MGPFEAFGKIFNTVGTLVDVVDNTVTRSAKLIDKGFDVVEIPLEGMLEDMRCDEIVSQAKREAKKASAQAEARLITNRITESDQ